MYKTIFLLFFTVQFYSAIIAQDQIHEHEHQHVHEIGVSVSPVYFVNEEELSVSTHLHYVYNFPHTKFGLGLGFEQVFDEHNHRFIGPEINYRPFHRLTLNLSPGIAFEGSKNPEKDFALHFETVYEFEVGVFHIGPVFEVAWHPEDYHISLGVHVGLGL